MFLKLLFILSFLCVCKAGTKSKPHGHQGVLQPYSGKHIPYSITLEQNNRLEKGEPIVINERTGKGGRGFVIQDVHAHPTICMDRILDMKNYPKVVPKVKNVQVYDEVKFENGTVQQKAEFSVGMPLLTLTYFLNLRYEPSLYTSTWTLDYQYNSDFDDTVGHWQVMPHPTKNGWSRILYSTEVKLFSWIPEFVVSYLTKTALVESTTWVKKESEIVAKSSKEGNFAALLFPDLSPCFIVNDEGAKYETSCIDNVVKPKDEL